MSLHLAQLVTKSLECVGLGGTDLFVVVCSAVLSCFFCLYKHVVIRLYLQQLHVYVVTANYTNYTDTPSQPTDWLQVTRFKSKHRKHTSSNQPESCHLFQSSSLLYVSQWSSCSWQVFGPPKNGELLAQVFQLSEWEHPSLSPFSLSIRRAVHAKLDPQGELTGLVNS